jgi:hypothetical protein
MAAEIMAACAGEMASKVPTRKIIRIRVRITRRIRREVSMGFMDTISISDTGFSQKTNCCLGETFPKATGWTAMR